MSGQERQIRLEPSWRAALAGEFDAPYMQSLSAFLREEKRARKVIYPANDQIFAALDATPVESARVVIIGQDPYHGPGQAHGLCFSVQPGTALPPSLINIFNEIDADIGAGAAPMIEGSGCLLPWAEQGVLLLNSVLTVERAQAASHRDKGWEQFTDAVVAHLNEAREHLVFMLWGAYAQRKGAVIDRTRHCVLHAPHPSPLSAHRGFFGCRHFSRANDYLAANGYATIDWRRVG
ncbi:MAG: uracil-DNA glycosylase [Pseudomonadota bacterium]